MVENAGRRSQPYFPFILTIFTFIISANLLGMFPFGYAITSQVLVTFLLSCTVFLGSIFIGLRKHKINFFSLFFPAGSPPRLSFLLVPIEILSFVSRPFSLGIRLFANMLAGHVLLKILSGFVITVVLISQVSVFVDLENFLNRFLFLFKLVLGNKDLQSLDFNLFVFLLKECNVNYPDFNFLNTFCVNPEISNLRFLEVKYPKLSAQELALKKAQFKQVAKEIGEVMGLEHKLSGKLSAKKLSFSFSPIKKAIMLPFDLRPSSVLIVNFPIIELKPGFRFFSYNLDEKKESLKIIPFNSFLIERGGKSLEWLVKPLMLQTNEVVLGNGIFFLSLSGISMIFNFFIKLILILMSLVVLNAFILLELGIAFLQAYVFVILSSIYIGDALNLH